MRPSVKIFEEAIVINTKNKIFTLLRILFSIVGLFLGYRIALLLHRIPFLIEYMEPMHYRFFDIFCIILFGIIFYLLWEPIMRLIQGIIDRLEKELQDYSIVTILWGVLGMIIGLVVAYLISIPLYRIDIPYVMPLLSLILYIILAYMGLQLGMRGYTDLQNNPSIFKNIPQPIRKNQGSIPKVLDTSVIMDGRIVEIEKMGFLEGPLYVPFFVLKELQNISDSSDSLKRNRGRRGLDYLKAMQEDGRAEIIISEKDYPEIAEVDSKIMRLAKDLKGVIVTNDFNLNKVAKVQEIGVLNINELANAIKPVVLPGEELTLEVVKPGNQENQGVAYLDDGTMIVIEEGYEYIGKKVHCIVTSVLQTPAGKMIFARPKELIHE